MNTPTEPVEALIAELKACIDLDGFGCACEPAYRCQTCRARDVMMKLVQPAIRKYEAAASAQAAAVAQPTEEFDVEAMRRIACQISEFAGQALLMCCEEIDRLRAAAAPVAQPSAEPKRRVTERDTPCSSQGCSWSRERGCSICGGDYVIRPAGAGEQPCLKS